MTDWRKKLRDLNRYEHGPSDIERRVALFRDRVERNKTRRRRDGGPPAALPAPVEPRPHGGGLTGGAAAALSFDEPA